MSYQDNPPYLTVQKGPVDTLYHAVLMVYDPVGDGYLVSRTWGNFTFEVDAYVLANSKAEDMGIVEIR